MKDFALKTVRNTSRSLFVSPSVAQKGHYSAILSNVGTNESDVPDAGELTSPITRQDEEGPRGPS